MPSFASRAVSSPPSLGVLRHDTIAATQIYVNDDQLRVNRAMSLLELSLE
jgi:hypothetical protein